MSTDDFDDTDELPSTSQVFEVPVDSPASPTASDRAADRAATTPLPSRATDVAETRRTTRDPVDEVATGARPARFASSRRRALLVLAAADRPVDYGPTWATVVAGVVAILWAAVLAGAAAGGVSRATTTLVGLLNLGVGAGGFLLGWVRPDVPTLLLVLAAQVVGFGVLQLVASLRR